MRRSKFSCDQRFLLRKWIPQFTWKYWNQCRINESLLIHKIGLPLQRLWNLLQREIQNTYVSCITKSSCRSFNFALAMRVLGPNLNFHQLELPLDYKKTNVKIDNGNLPWILKMVHRFEIIQKNSRVVRIFDKFNQILCSQVQRDLNLHQ